jgi:hypothetical protein
VTGVVSIWADNLHHQVSQTTASHQQTLSTPGSTQHEHSQTLAPARGATDRHNVQIVRRTWYSRSRNTSSEVRSVSSVVSFICTRCVYSCSRSVRRYRVRESSYIQDVKQAVHMAQWEVDSRIHIGAVWVGRTMTIRRLPRAAAKHTATSHKT